MKNELIPNYNEIAFSLRNLSHSKQKVNLIDEQLFEVKDESIAITPFVNAQHTVIYESRTSDLNQIELAKFIKTNSKNIMDIAIVAVHGHQRYEELQLCQSLIFSFVDNCQIHYNYSKDPYQYQNNIAICHIRDKINETQIVSIETDLMPDIELFVRIILKTVKI